MRLSRVAVATMLAGLMTVSVAYAQDIPADLAQARADRRESMIRGNPAAFDRLTAATWISVDQTGKVENKADRASRIVAPATPPQGPLAPPQRLNERTSIFNGDTAIFFWQQTMPQGLQNFIETWVKENGQWKCASSHMSLPVAPPGRAAAAVQAIPGILAEGARFTRVFETVGNNVDGIVAASDGSLLASQEDNNAVLTIDKDDRASVYLAGVAVGSLSIDRQGRLFAVRRMAQAGTPAATQASAPKTSGVSMLLPEFKMWETLDNGTPMMARPSDLAADGTGGAYFTQQTVVYYASPSGAITLAGGEKLRVNGIVLSPDDTRLYVTNDASIAVFDVQGPGKLANQREFTTLRDGGNGDGLAVDTAGNLYVAAGPGVQIYNRTGTYLGLIPTPPGRPTGQAFAGADRKTLYVTVQSTTDAHGRPMAGRTVYRIPMLAQGLANRSK